VKTDESKKTRLQDRSRGRHRNGIPWQQRGRAGKPRSGQKSGPAIRLPLFGLSQIAPRVGQIGGLFGLDGFLREHYMTSRETAAAMSSYLRGLDSGPAPARASKRAARGDDNAKLNERKNPASKPGEARGPGESKASESRPADILAPEPGSAARKPSVPAAGEAKPAEGTRQR
jgi:hypothetical protein